MLPAVCILQSDIKRYMNAGCYSINRRGYGHEESDPVVKATAKSPT